MKCRTLGSIFKQQKLKNNSSQRNCQKQKNLITSLRFKNRNLQNENTDYNSKLLLANTTIEKLQHQIGNYEKKVSRLNAELTKHVLNFTEHEYAMQAKVLSGVLVYADAAAGIKQAEFIQAFQYVHDQRLKGPDCFNTKLQKNTVEKVFANAHDIAKNSGFKKEWFNDNNLVIIVTKATKKQ